MIFIFSNYYSRTDVAGARSKRDIEEKIENEDASLETGAEETLDRNKRQIRSV